MNSSAKKNRKLNFGLTRKVIELQAKGYHFDYLLLGDRLLLCLQNNRAIPLEAVDIQVVDQGYDQFSRSFKYVHAIDTGNGEMGVMIAEAIITSQTYGVS